MSGKLEKNAKQQYLLPNLPLGQPVTLVAFTKNNGQVYQCKEEFVIKADKVIKPDFKKIVAEELKMMFGANVKISPYLFKICWHGFLTPYCVNNKTKDNVS